jgi:hypothetical protein
MTRHNVGDIDVAQFPHSENVYVYLESRSHIVHCNIMQLDIDCESVTVTLTDCGCELTYYVKITYGS